MIAQIIHGDCIKVMRQFPYRYVDLVVTSPPYDDIKKYNSYVFDYKKVINELYRIMKIGGVVVWIVADQHVNYSETGSSFKQALYFMKKFKLYDTMIFYKSAPSYHSEIRYQQAFDYMFVFSKGKPKTINLLKERKKSFYIKNKTYIQRDRLGIKKYSKCRSPNRYKIRDNVWKYNIGNNQSTSKWDKFAHEHTAIFPEKLVEDHILSWSVEGDLVLDPFCGSGTTCKMALKLNRNTIGIDISKEYCELAKKRIEGYVNQKRLEGYIKQ